MLIITTATTEIFPPLCTGKINTNGSLSTDSDYTRLADRYIFARPACINAYERSHCDQCCYHSYCSSCSTSYIADDSCCKNQKDNKKEGAFILFDLAAAKPFSSLSMSIYHYCDASEYTRICDPKSEISSYYCKLSSCPASGIRDSCLNNFVFSKITQSNECSSSQGCYITYDIIGQAISAFVSGWDTLGFRLESSSETHYYTWPHISESPCIRSGSYCGSVNSQKFTGVYLLPSQLNDPYFTASRSCTNSSSCYPKGEGYDCLDTQNSGNYQCGECLEHQGVACKDVNGDNGFCCGGQCVSVGFSWQDTNQNRVPDSGIDRCGTESCTSFIMCNGNEWSCNSTGNICCYDTTTVGHCDDSGICSDQEYENCAPNKCSGGLCVTTCSSDNDCLEGYVCVDIYGDDTKTCKKSCSDALVCGNGEFCVDSDKDGVEDVCDSCSKTGSKCSHTASDGYCCGGFCFPTTYTDSNQDNILNENDQCGNGSCAGSLFCSSGWACSSENNYCCSEDSEGKCVAGLCNNLETCSPYSCTNGRCASNCTETSDCDSGYFCVDVSRTGSIDRCATCSETVGFSCKTSSGVTGRCCGDTCSIIQDYNNYCNNDCQCGNGLQCVNGRCKKSNYNNCTSPEECAGECCADNICKSSHSKTMLESCNDNCECEEGLVCSQNICKKKIGAACFAEVECESYCCMNNQCMPPGLKKIDEECANNCECEKGLVCFKESGQSKGKCLLDVGYECYKDVECSSECCADNQCALKNGLSIFSICSKNCECPNNMTCHNNQCLKENGQFCTQHIDCVSGICNTVCTSKGVRSVKESCESTQECLEDLICHNNTCLYDLNGVTNVTDECVSQCTNDGRCSEPGSLILGARCTHNCTCGQNQLCDENKQICVAKKGSYCLKDVNCHSMCCANHVCVDRDALEDGNVCVDDCQCVSKKCDNGICRKAKSCETKDDCLKGELCVDSICKEGCEPEGAQCNSQNTTGYCCDNTCIESIDEPYSSCGDTGCGGNLVCENAMWRCNSYGRDCCNNNSVGVCSYSGICGITKICPRTCINDTFIVSTCTMGRCSEEVRRNCFDEGLICSNAQCIGCENSDQCSHRNMCKDNVLHSYQCIENRCQPQKDDCSKSNRICSPYGCSGCNNEQECKMKYGVFSVCDRGSGLCKRASCKDDSECPNTCEKDVFKKYACVNFECVEDDTQDCSNGKFCTSDGCQDCQDHSSCTIGYGLDYSCVEGSCIKNCGNGQCDDEYNETCLSCAKDCICDSAFLCDPGSHFADQIGCMKDSDGDSSPDSDDPRPVDQENYCENSKNCLNTCYRNILRQYLCKGNTCVSSSMRNCNDVGRICDPLTGECGNCNRDILCKKRYGFLYSCIDGKCLLDVDGDKISDAIDPCPHSKSLTECEKRVECRAGWDNCLSNELCKCSGDTPVCAPNRRKSDVMGCVAPHCGDSFCDKPIESSQNCCDDCGCLLGKTCDAQKHICVGGCGDSICEPQECSSCKIDCDLDDCLNDVCESERGENCGNTPDCTCKVVIQTNDEYKFGISQKEEINLQILNSGNAKDTYKVKIVSNDIYFNIKEFISSEVAPNSVWSVSVPLETAKKSGKYLILITVQSKSNNEINAAKEVNIILAEKSFVEKATEGTILGDILGLKDIAEIVILTFSIGAALAYTFRKRMSAKREQANQEKWSTARRIQQSYYRTPSWKY